jgi:hypothetical protein
MSQGFPRRNSVRIVTVMIVAIAFAWVGRADSAPNPTVDSAAAAPKLTVAPGFGAVNDPKNKARGVAPQSSSSGGRAGDFTADGKTDLFARNKSDGGMYVYPGSGALNGAATFGAGVKITGDWRNCRWIGQGDFNGAGHADAACVDSAGVLFLAINNGSGLAGTNTLKPLVRAGSGWQAYDLITAADINGDGFADLAAKRSGTGDLYIFLNSGTINGDATFGAPILGLQGLGSAVDIEWVDLTGDDALDLVFGWSSGGVTIQYVYDVFADQDSTGRFIAKTYALSQGWETTNAMVFADVNSDSFVDLVFRGTSSGTLVAIPHSRVWNFANPPTVLTFGSAQQIGTNWNVNDIVT